MTDRTCPVCQASIDEGALTCPVCHFKLSGATQRFKPLFNDAAGNDDDSKRKVRTLRMVRGPQIGTVFDLEDVPITIGRNPKCDIFLDDMTVSREHADITRHGDVLVIRDLKSFNGVWINNKTKEEHSLKPDDYVQIGKYDFVYEEKEEPEEEAVS